MGRWFGRKGLGRKYQLSPSRSLNYATNLRHLWDQPLQRLQIYCQPFQFPGGSYKVSPQAICNSTEWIGVERYFSIIEETIPFRQLTAKEQLALMARCLRGPTMPVDANVCALIDYLNIQPNYYHWFLDALPRVFAAEAYGRRSGETCHLVVPECLAPWQQDSLLLMGLSMEKLIRVPLAPGHGGWEFNHLITSFSHRHTRHSTTGHFDALCPLIINQLSERLIDGAERHSNTDEFSPRIYVSRGQATLRQVRNEEAIMTLLSPHGFSLLHLDTMPLHEQIQRFHRATHVISSHGGALTNLLYLSPGCQVLEIFQQGHGVRPDFFQLTALRGGIYSFCVVPSLNAKNDIEIPLAVLKRFLEASL
ncbi:MAG: glycosyltransferase family 61 protein [Cyanobium sp.]